MPELIAELGTRALIELGAGSAEKSRIILRAMRATGTPNLYVPIDVSATFLNLTARRLRHEFPGLNVEPLVADISEEFGRPRRHLPSRALRISGRHYRQFLSPRGDSPAQPGAERHGAERPFPDRSGSPEEH